MITMLSQSAFNCNLTIAFFSLEWATIAIRALHTPSKRIIWKIDQYEKFLYLLGENEIFIILPRNPLQEFLQSNLQLIADF